MPRTPKYCSQLSSGLLDVDVVLVGDEPTLTTELARVADGGHPRLQIRHASQVVTMDDHPAKVFVPVLRKGPEVSQPRS